MLKTYESLRKSPNSYGGRKHRSRPTVITQHIGTHTLIDDSMTQDNRQPEPSVKWTCILCSYKNWPNATKCVMCNKKRNGTGLSRSAEDMIGAVGGPTNTELASSEEQCKWKCSRCTYENWPRSSKCTLCHSSKPSSPPLTPLISAVVSEEGSCLSQCSLDITELQSKVQLLCMNDKIKQIRNKMNEIDWLFINACIGVVNNELSAVQLYIQATAGGEKGRQLTRQEVTILNKPSVYAVGTTLVHLALRFQRTDILCQLLTPATSDARKRLPSQSNGDLAASIRHEVVGLLKVHKGDWPCVFMSQMNTFFIPQDVDRFTPGTQRKLFEDIVDKEVDRNLRENEVINWSEELVQELSSRLYPLWNRTAGDCLLDSLLQATWGVMDRDNSLRKAMADSLNDGASRFILRWKVSEKMLSTAQGYDVCESQLMSDWSSLGALARKPGKSLEQIHIFVLAHVLRRPIIVYGVKVVMNINGEPLGTVNFDGIYLPLLWEANFCWQSPLALGYTRGHFSALVGSRGLHRSHDQGIYLPLVDYQGHTLPVHYLTEQEMGSQDSLLKEYCDCCLTKGGTLVAKQHFVQQSASVSNLLEEWMMKYKKMDKKRLHQSVNSNRQNE